MISTVCTLYCRYRKVVSSIKFLKVENILPKCLYLIYDLKNVGFPNAQIGIFSWIWPTVRPNATVYVSRYTIGEYPTFNFLCMDRQQHE